jgi:transposase-like protein
VLEGSKALAAGIREVFDRPVIQRCQLHKIRNVRDHLPQKLRSVVVSRMRRAYHADSALEAQAQLETLAGELDKTHPGAAASLREGLEDTLPVRRLAVPPPLARTLRSTNAVVIWSRAEAVRHVADERSGPPVLPGGRGYLPRSSTRVTGRFDDRFSGGDAGVAA